MGRISKPLKERVLAQLATGATPEQVSESTGVRLPTVLKWSGTKPAGTVSTEPVGNGAVLDATPPIVTQPLGESLADLAGKHPGAPISAIPPIPETEPAPKTPPSAERSEPTSPPLDGAALILTVKMLKAGAVQMVAAGWGISLGEEQIDALSKFTPLEEKQLEVCAPYAASYTPLINDYAKPVMALGFLVVVGLSTARSIAQLKPLRPAKPQKPPVGSKKDAK